MNYDHKKLHEKFSTLGRERNRLTYELLAMLPRIYDEGIYREHKCATIYEYAGKYAGLSHSVVEKTLKLHKELEGKPFLREAIRTQGVHKVALVAKIATAETDEVLAQRVKDMSQPALQELSKELRQKVEINQITIEQVGDDETVNPRLCRAAQESMTISLDPEMQFLFLKLKKEFEKNLGVNLSNKSALRAMLEELAGASGVEHDDWAVGIANEGAVETGKMADDITGNKIKNGPRQQKRHVVKNFVEEKIDGSGEMLCGDIMDERDHKIPWNGCKDAVGGMTEYDGKVAECVNGVRAGMKKIDSNIFKRYIPMMIRKVVLNETRGRCAYPGCNRPYENFHHRERFGNGGRHDSIVPVCRAHHEFAHNGLVWRELADVREWELDLVESGSGSFADKRCIERGIWAWKGG